jgi:restriction system protein
VALLAGGSAAIARLRRRKLYDGQTSIESIRALAWSQFEQLIGEAYRRQGYEVQENLVRGADGGVDLRLRKDGQTTLVQCKPWKAYKVGVQTVRELYGVVMAEKAGRGVLVTSGVFTKEARQWAEAKPLELIDGEGLRRLVAHVQPPSAASISAPPSASVACPKCGQAMVLRTSRKGATAGSQFWGCSAYPICKGMRRHDPMEA